MNEQEQGNPKQVHEVYENTDGTTVSRGTVTVYLSEGQKVDELAFSRAIGEIIGDLACEVEIKRQVERKIYGGQTMVILGYVAVSHFSRWGKRNVTFNRPLIVGLE